MVVNNAGDNPVISRQSPVPNLRFLRLSLRFMAAMIPMRLVDGEPFGFAFMNTFWVNS